MLIIRKEQFQAFEQSVLGNYKRSLIEQFDSYKLRFKSLTNKQEFKNIVSKGADKAQSYNIVDKEDMNAYIEYMITKGENFDTTGSQINEILTNPDFDGEEKIEELDIYFSEPKED